MYREVTYIWSIHFLFEESDKNGGLLLFIVFIILIAGFLLYVLLKPPVDIIEEPAVMELRPEFKLSSLNLPEYSKNQSHSSLQAEEE
jgi:TRAP-type mannitol/chloroaromatic compound transport system permease small subunit